MVTTSQPGHKGLSLQLKMELDKFRPRKYQKNLFEAWRSGKQRMLLVWHRRAGKDLCCLMILLHSALQRIGNYYYVLPTQKQAKNTVWEGKTNEGKLFLDFIPRMLIDQIYQNEMKIRLINGSIIQFLGSENVDRLRGVNPAGVVFSEAAFQREDAYTTLRPALLANNAWAILVSTPFGQNHFYKLYEVARHSPEWFCELLSIEDTEVVFSPEQIQREIEEGIMSAEMAYQEYYCDFKGAAEGSYYAKYLNDMELDGRIGSFPYEPSFPVYTSWDLGRRDNTFIIFWQKIGPRQIHIIDTYTNNSVGLEHYAQVVLTKPYIYAKDRPHWAPHDIAVTEFSSNLSRIDKAKQLGINFAIKTDKYGKRSSMVPNIPVIDGIEAVRSTLPRISINEDLCRPLIDCLREYRREYDNKLRVFKLVPRHDQHSHPADALRYMCLSIPLTQSGYTKEQRYADMQKAYGGNRFGGPFDDPGTPFRF